MPRLSRVRTPAERRYLAALALGVALPYAQALPWFAEHRLDVRRFLDEAFATRISSFFGWDVLAASGTLLLLAATDEELSRGQRAAVAVGAAGGSSIGLPLYLWMRARNQRIAAAADPSQ